MLTVVPATVSTTTSISGAAGYVLVTVYARKKMRAAFDVEAPRASLQSTRCERGHSDQGLLDPGWCRGPEELMVIGAVRVHEVQRREVPVEDSRAIRVPRGRTRSGRSRQPALRGGAIDDDDLIAGGYALSRRVDQKEIVVSRVPLRRQEERALVRSVAGDDRRGGRRRVAYLDP